MPAALHETWRATRARAPGATAVVEAATGRTWTRAALDAEAARIVDELSRVDGLAGRRVVLTGPNSAGWLAAFLALSEVGAVVAPLDPGEPEDARRALARRIGAPWTWAEGGLHATGVRPRRRDASGVRLLKLTSGSTGAPRALPFTAAQLLADGAQVCATMGVTGADANLALIPFGHSYGLGNLVLPLLLHGAAVVCGSGPLPGLIAADCARWRPTVFPAVPALVRGLVLAELPREALAGLRTVISAGAPLEPALAVAFREKYGPTVHGFYGSSETGGITYDRDGAATASGRGAGTPLEGVRLHPGRGGRFLVESAAVTGRGRHSPKDRGRIEAGGGLVLLGRVGRIVKVEGRRLDLGEVEALLRGVPGVREACALADPRRPDAVAAVVAGGPSAAGLRAALAGRAAAWKIPRRIVVVDEWPLTARGKTDRRALEARLRAPG